MGISRPSPLQGETVQVLELSDAVIRTGSGLLLWGLDLPSKKNLTGSAIARMDDKKDYRGWDIWIEGGKPATHIVHKWPDNALKVVSTNH